MFLGVVTISSDDKKVNRSGAGFRTGKNNSSQKSRGASRPDKNFKSQLESVEKEMIREKLDELLDNVDKSGEKLKRTMEKEDMLEYKLKVKEFLRFIQQEVARARKSHSWDNQGNLKTYTIIEKINQKLEDLQNKFLQSQAETLEVVRKIDEIRGLMLDLYI